MKKALMLGVIMCLGCGLLLSAGCTKRAASSSEAIKNADTLKTVQEKVDYLIGQAKAFYGSKEYQQAINLAQNVLKLDSSNQAAKDLIEKAKAQLQAAAQKAAGDVSKKLLGN